jgi:hypothetical protein
MQRPRTELPTQQDFSSAVNSRFDVRQGDGTAVEFTLVECNGVLSNERQECYSLMFRGPADQPPVQSIYVLENDKLGTMELFLVPVKKDDHGLYFEAVMNHLLS